MAGRHLTEADHDKALHDALNIDADTVDGQHASAFAGASHNHDGSDITTGVLSDARIAQSSVTQHEAALTITESQISDLDHYTTTDANADIDARVDKAFVDALNVDADTVDGQHASDFADASHTHADYVETTGDTMTGALTIDSSTQGLIINVDTSSTYSIFSNYGTDSSERFSLEGDGAMNWGPGGTTSPEIRFERLSDHRMGLTADLYIEHDTGSITHPVALLLKNTLESEFVSGELWIVDGGSFAMIGKNANIVNGNFIARDTSASGLFFDTYGEVIEIFADTGLTEDGIFTPTPVLDYNSSNIGAWTLGVPLYADADPVDDLEVATKQYVDDRLNLVAKAEASSDQSGITSQVDINGMSVTVDLIAGEPVNIEAFVPLRYGVGETASVLISLWVSENGGAYSKIAQDRRYASFISNERWTAYLNHFYTPGTTTSYTFKLTAERDIGSNNFRVNGETTRTLSVYYPGASYNYATEEYVDGESWTTPSLSNSHAAIGGAYAAPSYRKAGNVVTLRGVVDTENAPGTGYEIFDLPAGYRPADREIFICAARMGQTYGVTRVDVATNGSVLIQPGGGPDDHLDVLGANNAWVSLSGISFVTDE